LIVFADKAVVTITIRVALALATSPPYTDLAREAVIAVGAVNTVVVFADLANLNDCTIAILTARPNHAAPTNAKCPRTAFEIASTRGALIIETNRKAG
jgi:hypothetical protein